MICGKEMANVETREDEGQRERQTNHFTGTRARGGAVREWGRRGARRRGHREYQDSHLTQHTDTHHEQLARVTSHGCREEQGTGNLSPS